MASDFTTLRVAFLKAAGLLQDGGRKIVWWRWSRGSHELIKVLWDPIGSMLIISNEAGQQSHVIKVEREGERIHLICPMSAQRCKALFLVGGQLGGRVALGLRYASEFVSDWEREQANRGAIPNRGRYVPRDPILLYPPEPALRSSKLARNNWLGTRAGLHFAAETPPSGRLLARERLEDKRLQSPRPALATSAGSRRPTSIFEEHARLEVLELYVAGLMVEGEVRHGLAIWHPGSHGIEVANFIVDLTDEAEPHLLIESYNSPDSDWWQRIELTKPGPRNRPRRSLVCPVSGHPCEMLAFRNGVWASRSAQRLVNQSQRSPRFSTYVHEGRREK